MFKDNLYFKKCELVGKFSDKFWIILGFLLKCGDDCLFLFEIKFYMMN